MSIDPRERGQETFACRRNVSDGGRRPPRPIEALRSEAGFAQALQEIVAPLAAGLGPARGRIVDRAAHLSRQDGRADCAFEAWRGSCGRGRHDGSLMFEWRWGNSECPAAQRL